jgi:CRP-like cAMP-binding protein
MTASVSILREALTTLSPAQVRAVTALVGGATHVEAAQAAGVARETVSRWLAHHPAMRAAITEAQVAAVAEHVIALADLRTRATNVAVMALDALADALADGTLDDPVAALRAIAPLTTGPSLPLPVINDPGTLIDAEVRARRKVYVSTQDDMIYREENDALVARLAAAADVAE